jgi:hypothetical protein
MYLGAGGRSHYDPAMRPMNRRLPGPNAILALAALAACIALPACKPMKPRPPQPVPSQEPDAPKEEKRDPSKDPSAGDPEWKSSSSLGKARDSAVRLKVKVDEYEQEVSKQADEVFKKP